MRDRRCPISRLQPRQGAASGQDNALARVAPPLEWIARFDDFLEVAPNEEQAAVFGFARVFGKGRSDFGTSRPAEATRRKAESRRAK
jgi:hypothetical protein